MKIEGSACIGFECLTRNRIEIICGYSTGGGLVNNTHRGGLQRSKFPLKRKKEREGESLALLQI